MNSDLFTAAFNEAIDALERDAADRLASAVNELKERFLKRTVDATTSTTTTSVDISKPVTYKKQKPIEPTLVTVVKHFNSDFGLDQAVETTTKPNKLNMKSIDKHFAERHGGDCFPRCYNTKTNEFEKLTTFGELADSPSEEEDDDDKPEKLTTLIEPATSSSEEEEEEDENEDKDDEDKDVVMDTSDAPVAETQDSKYAAMVLVVEELQELADALYVDAKEMYASLMPLPRIITDEGNSAFVDAVNGLKMIEAILIELKEIRETEDVETLKESGFFFKHLNRLKTRISIIQKRFEDEARLTKDKLNKTGTAMVKEILSDGEVVEIDVTNEIKKMVRDMPEEELTIMINASIEEATKEFRADSKKRKEQAKRDIISNLSERIVTLIVQFRDDFARLHTNRDLDDMESLVEWEAAEATLHRADQIDKQLAAIEKKKGNYSNVREELLVLSKEIEELEVKHGFRVTAPAPAPDSVVAEPAAVAAPNKDTQLAETKDVEDKDAETKKGAEGIVIRKGYAGVKMIATEKPKSRIETKLKGFKREMATLENSIAYYERRQAGLSKNSEPGKCVDLNAQINTKYSRHEHCKEQVKILEAKLAYINNRELHDAKQKDTDKETQLAAAHKTMDVLKEEETALKAQLDEHNERIRVIESEIAKPQEPAESEEPIESEEPAESQELSSPTSNKRIYSVKMPMELSDFIGNEIALVTLEALRYIMHDVPTLGYCFQHDVNSVIPFILKKLMLDEVDEALISHIIGLCRDILVTVSQSVQYRYWFGNTTFDDSNMYIFSKRQSMMDIQSPEAQRDLYGEISGYAKWAIYNSIAKGVELTIPSTPIEMFTPADQDSISRELIVRFKHAINDAMKRKHIEITTDYSVIEEVPAEIHQGLARVIEYLFSNPKGLMYKRVEPMSFRHRAALFRELFTWSRTMIERIKSHKFLFQDMSHDKLVYEIDYFVKETESRISLAFSNLLKSSS